MPTVQEFIESAVHMADKECQHTEYFVFSETHVVFRTNLPSLSKHLREYYQKFLSERMNTESEALVIEALQYETAKLTIEGNWRSVPTDLTPDARTRPAAFDPEEGVVHAEPETGLYLISSHDRHICVGPVDQHVNHVINFINNVYLDAILAKQGYLFHASGICKTGVGIGMAGHAGVGKSTLALRLLERHFDLVSNDRLAVSEDNSHHLVMQGIARYPRINPGTALHQKQLTSLIPPEERDRYLALDVEELWALEHKYDVFIEESFGSRMELAPIPMKMFVLLDWHRDRSLGPPQLIRQDPETLDSLIQTVIKPPYPYMSHCYQRGRKSSMEPYFELLKHTEFYILTGNVDFDAGADLIEQALLTHAAA